MPVPPQRLCRNLDARRRSLGWISKGSALPVVTVWKNPRDEPEARHGRVSGERNERRSPFTRRAGKPHHLRSCGFGSRENDDPEPSTPKKLFRCTERVPTIGRPHEDGTFLPELPGDCPQSIDPGRALPSGCGRVAGGAEDGGGAALGHPYRQSSPRQPASRQNRIEQLDTCRDRLCSTMSDRSCIRKSLLEERSKKGRGGQRFWGLKELT